MDKKMYWKGAAALLLAAAAIGIIWFAGRQWRSEKPVTESTAEPSRPEEKATEEVPEKESTAETEEEELKETEGASDREGTEEETPSRDSGREEEEMEEEEQAEEEYRPPVVAVVSDLHYQSRSITDFGKAYYDFVVSGDGKVVQYLPELLDAFLEEIIDLNPTALILSGDITMNGEIENHQELSQKLREVVDLGIPVLVIPGNHDINNHHASRYFGSEKTAGQPITPEQFLEFYHWMGYDQAISRDSASLSYIYPLDERYWMMMLDTCQYEPVNLVGGRIQEETLVWMEEQMEKAKEAGVTVIPVGHHNLLPQSSLYTTDCALENYQEITDFFESWEIPVYVSGHLHVQRLKQHDRREMPEEKLGPGAKLAAIREAEDAGEKAGGIYEIVSDAVSIPPCQYGEIRWDEEGNMTYRTRQVDVSAWAVKNGSDNPDLLDFENYSREYIKKIIARQIENKMDPMTLDFLDEMTGLYADLYQDYYAGRIIDSKAVYGSVPWQWWIRLLPESRQVREMRAMVGDSEKDNNYLYLPISEEN